MPNRSFKAEMPWRKCAILLGLVIASGLFAPSGLAAGPIKVFVAGDSTAADNGPEQPIGWGVVFQEFFDPTRAEVVNLSKGGRSSRTFYTEGRWQALLEKLKPGDVVLIQFGHNDSSRINDDSRARGSIPGVGNESQEIENMLTHRHEVVRSFGWYMRKFVEQAKAAGAIPIVISPTVRNRWSGGRVERGPGEYRKWAKVVADEEHVPFLDLSDLAANAAEAIGAKAFATYFKNDYIHTNRDGAEFNASWIVAGLKGLKIRALDGTFSPKGRLVPLTDPPLFLP